MGDLIVVSIGIIGIIAGICGIVIDTKEGFQSTLPRRERQG